MIATRLRANLAIAVTLLSLTCAASAEPVTLRVASWIDYGNAVHESGWHEILDDFHKAYPEIRVELAAFSWSEYWEKVPILLAGGDVDVLDMTLVEIPKYIEAGMLLDLTPYFERDLDPADYYATSIDRGRWPWPDGRLYTIWTMMSPTIVYYNMNLFERAGLDHPGNEWTYTESIPEIARKLLRDLNGDGVADQFGVAMGFNNSLTDRGGYGLGAVRLSFGASDYDETYSRFQLDTPENVAAMEYVYEFLRSGLTQPGITVNTFLAGDLGIWFHSPWLAPRLAEGAHFQWQTAPVPTGPKGRWVPLHGNPSVAIAASTPHPEAAWTFVRFLIETQTPTRVVLEGNIPTRRDAAAEGLSIAEQQWPGFRSDAGRISLESSVFTPAISPRQPEANNVIVAQLRRAQEGEIPIEAALAEATRLANLILAGE